MTDTVTESPCAFCGEVSTTLIEPPRRTLDRGPDPNDDSFSITVILPDIPLCDLHARLVGDGDFRLGWCDNEQCRIYGEAGTPSACGAPFAPLASTTRSRSKSH
jgi:hypothetical protein